MCELSAVSMASGKSLRALPHPLLMLDSSVEFDPHSCTSLMPIYVPSP